MSMNGPDHGASGLPMAGSDRDLDARQRRILEVMNRVKAAYYKTKNDEQLEVHLRRIERGIQDGSEPGHILMISGESAAGKSTIVKRGLRLLTTLRDYEDEYGEMMRPTLYVRAPVACSMVDLNREILELLGYEGNVIGSPTTVGHKTRRTLRNFGTKLVVIDDFQHVFDAPKKMDPRIILHTLKNSLQDVMWPLHFVLVGLPDIDGLVDYDPHKEMERRTDQFAVEDLCFEEDKEYVAWILDNLIRDRAGLAMSREQPFELIARIMHGARDRFGLILPLIYHAIEDALETDSTEVSTQNWIEAYARLAKCGDNDAENVMHADNWRSIIRTVDRHGNFGPVDASSASGKGRRK
ncbi:TniB family NTP-binding protein [Rhizobium sp. NTR19]|uniref:TniB family NTP-binding protein n=1 Tax=Neorhizobium turbinariae TaxID=2937795 RepID=A0ABT0IXK9_9HYPH|nr:TniB family NTP-binding protein [Neorhizobium turbinariae]MCK8782616.1 TniB family NTP-binding protein [Neorhizobium turbinariae]